MVLDFGKATCDTRPPRLTRICDANALAVWCYTLRRAPDGKVPALSLLHAGWPVERDAIEACVEEIELAVA